MASNLTESKRSTENTELSLAKQLSLSPSFLIKPIILLNGKIHQKAFLKIIYLNLLLVCLNYKKC